MGLVLLVLLDVEVVVLTVEPRGLVGFVGIGRWMPAK